ncbi:hypothetical protein C8Q73DRAFT_717738 [Cubamyces lactineus]|nr:hypothetical protein C8Q73DRAFT_717738 [Cubamyces lactineus]
MLTSEGAVKPVVSLVSLVARRLGVTVALVPTPSRMRERSPMANVFIVGKLSRIELDGRAEMVNTEGTDKGFDVSNAWPMEDQGELLAYLYTPKSSPELPYIGAHRGWVCAAELPRYVCEISS